MIDYSYMIGIKYGYWTVNSVNYKTENNRIRAYAVCTCICGKQKSVRVDGILRGQSTNCGCKRFQNINIRHGGSKTRIYHIWQGMKARCLNPKNPEYKNYGGRGISVCDAWLEDFINFKDWAFNNGYTENLTIERINVNGNYEPDNCTWIAKSEQLKNTTKTIFITYNGETLCAMDWSKKLGIPNNVIINRYKSGLPPEKVLSTKRFYGKSFKTQKEVL